MSRLEDLPSELRLKIFEFCTEGYRYKLNLWIRPPCKRCSPSESGVATTHAQLAISTKDDEVDFPRGLLGTNRALRLDFATHLASDTAMQVWSRREMCKACEAVENLSDFVPQPWADLVQTIKFVPEPFALLPPTKAISLGFHSIRKVIFSNPSRLYPIQRNADNYNSASNLVSITQAFPELPDLSRLSCTMYLKSQMMKNGLPVADQKGMEWVVETELGIFCGRSDHGGYHMGSVAVSCSEHGQYLNTNANTRKQSLPHERMARSITLSNSNVS